MLPLIDSDGYRLVPQEFKSGGYIYKFVEKIDDDWQIYSVYSPNCEKVIDYELVRFTKSEEFVIAGNVITKKWNYPTANSFGKHGFSCHCVAGCYKKHREVVKRESERGQETVFELPQNKEFTVKDLCKELGLPYSAVYSKVKEVEDELKVVRVLKNKTGRDTKVYLYKNV